MVDRNDDSEPFDPDCHDEDLCEEDLVRPVREYALIVPRRGGSMCAAMATA